jgi:glutamate-5-semialdehyde dehydrogenase
MDSVLAQLKMIKKASSKLMLIDGEQRKKVLSDLSILLRNSSSLILKENHKDLQLMNPDDPKYDRLLLTEVQIQTLADDVEKVASLPDPLGSIIEEKTRPNGLCLKKISVPLGVVAVIYESRPNVTVDVFSLCFKSGNCCVLKGGKEAFHSNKILVTLIHQALQKNGIEINVVYLLPPERQLMNALLHAREYIDVCIPRGSQALIDKVRKQAQIPIIETGAGIVHTYFDLSGDVLKGRLIINNAKTRRISVCNALDTLIIHKQRLTDLPQLVELLLLKQVILFADELSYEVLQPIYPETLLQRALPKHYGIEFLDYKMSIKTVSNVQEAVDHIMHFTSGHSEAIIAEDETAIKYFLNHVDAAAVYVNASTAFTDGGQFGMGAEIGISTQKLHARGPMALKELTSSKWIIFGNGQIRE